MRMSCTQVPSLRMLVGILIEEQVLFYLIYLFILFLYNLVLILSFHLLSFNFNLNTCKYNRQHTATTPRPQKYGRSSSKSLSVHSEQTTTPQPSTGKRYNSRKNKHRTTTTSAPTTQEPTSYSRRVYKPKLQATPVESNPGSTSLYKFKLNRSPGRWQYKTTPKPRITIRKQGEDEQNEEKVTNSEASPAVSGGNNDVVTPQSRSDDSEGLVGSESVATIVDDDITSENKLDNAFPLETIKVEISTPPDFKDIYYEIATIKSPYTFQVNNF